MVREFYKHNVPQVFIKKWSDDAKHVSWYNPVTKEEKPNKTIVPLFRSPLIKLDIHEMMAISYLEANFTSYSKSLYESEFSNLKVGESVIRSEILFLFLGNPVYQERLILSSKELQKTFDLSPYSGDRLKVMKSALHSTYIESILCKIRLDEFLLYDLEPVILHAPAKRPFIIGGNPVVISNPLFGRDIHAFEFFAEPHLYKGAFIVLPICPDKALCLYDKDAYHLKSYRLSEKDADIINKQEIFSSGESDGIVYIGEKTYIDELSASLSGRKVTDGGSYPFETALSIMEIKENRGEFTMRDFVKDVRLYDDKNIRKFNIRCSSDVLEKRAKYFMTRFKDGTYINASKSPSTIELE